MQFSEQWLRTWVNPNLSSDELAHLLTMSGLEVEEQKAVAPAFNAVWVAQVLSVRKHPDADRLNICEVRVDADTVLQIVCGASNVAEGIKIPCARIGAVLPADFSIKQAKVRGVDSFGMLCSAKELGLAEEADGLWILPENAPVGTLLRDYLALDDTALTLKLTPNRADCLSILGVAREVAALTQTALPDWRIAPPIVALPASKTLQVLAPEACPYYAGRVLRGVNAAATTPLWMQQRLERSGLRCVSILVDITNYVLLEIGQPLHAFDLAKLSGDITVRFALPNESICLLNEKTVTLTTDMLVIADETGAQALAGIMGGQASAVHENTQSIFLESAWFAPLAIVGKSRVLGFGSDSSYRFERGVDFAATRAALDYASQLIVQLCGGELEAISEVEQAAALPIRTAVAVRRSQVNRVLGTDLALAQIASLLTRLQCNVLQAEEMLWVTAPSYRFDLEIEVDYIEEVARMLGYDALPTRLPALAQNMLAQGAEQGVFLLKQRLVERGYQEVINYAFVDKTWEENLSPVAAAIALQNPIASHLAVMRTQLLGGLLDTLQRQLKRSAARVKMMEFASVFLPQVDNTIAQPEKIAACWFGAFHPEQWAETARRVDFYDMKADVEALFYPRPLTFVATQHPALHPGRAANIVLAGKVVGVIGELHPQWVQSYALGQAPQLFEVDAAALAPLAVQKVGLISKQQAVRRDLALLTPESVSVQEVIDALLSVNEPLIQEISLFDVYRGKGIAEQQKSLAFKIIMQDTNKTLTDAEVEAVVLRLLESVNRLGIQLRS